MEILSKLGIDPYQFLIQLANFLILLILLRKFLYKPLLGVLEKRREAIQKSLQQVEEIQKQSSASQEEFLRIKTEARMEAEQILLEAKTLAGEKQEQILAQAKALAQGEMEKARQEIRNEKEKMLAEIKTEISSLVVLATEKVLEGVPHDALNKKLVKDAVLSVVKED